MRVSNGARSPDSTIAFRNGAAAASLNGKATIVGQPHLAETRILVVDEHPLFRHGVMNFINGQIDMAVCGSADSIPSVRTALTGCKPDLILLGLRLGTGDTLEFIKALTAQYPELRVLVFSQCDETIFAERALRAGANGYLMKQATNEELLTAIRDIVCGGIYVSRKIAILAFQKSLETPRQNYPRENVTDIEILSDREMHVFQLLGSGLGTKKIAETLKLSGKTIESHRENIKRKLGLRNGAELTEQATAWVMENFLPPEKGEISVVKKKKLLPFRAA
ncbi:MAG TPA: response regulator transcription factor [Candidatus Sulfotelmatobacter sp.]|nr:response regulator transcription factor [Candidatus Sulfotelmatobacter sp.]